MSATLAYNIDLLPQAPASPEAVSTMSGTNNATAKPGFFARIFEAIGKSYYVPTKDGEGFYMFPPI